MSKKSISIVFSLLILLFSLLINAINPVINNFKIGVVLSFSLNSWVFGSMCINSIIKHRYSFEFIHSFFLLFMMNIAPMIQYYTTNAFLSFEPDDTQIVFTNFLLLLWSVVFYIGYDYSSRNHKPQKKTYNMELQLKGYSTTIVGVLLLIESGYVLFVTGFNIFRNNSAESRFIGTGLPVLSFALRVTLVIVANIISFCLYKKNKKKLFFPLITLFLTLIIAFPTAIPRFVAATIYGGLILIIFSKKMKSSYLYSIMFIIGFVIIFPILSNFRYESDNINIFEMFMSVLTGFKREYNTGNYDGYMMLMRTIDYVSDNGIVWGKSLIGNTLFFIPRSLWSNKPVGSGAFIAEYYNFSFTNCSQSLMAESYLNFGIIGIFLYSFIVGYATQKYDYLYWDSNYKNTYSKLLYPFYIHLFFILLRGDFLTGYLYFFVITIFSTILFRLLLKKKYMDYIENEEESNDIS